MVRLEERVVALPLQGNPESKEGGSMMLCTGKSGLWLVGLVAGAALVFGCADDGPGTEGGFECEGGRCDAFGAGEQCTNGVDDDGNFLVDCLDLACAADQACIPSSCHTCSDLDRGGDVPREAEPAGRGDDDWGSGIAAAFFEHEQDVDWYRWRVDDSWSGTLLPRATVDLMESDNALLGLEVCAFYVPDSAETNVACRVGRPTTDVDLDAPGCCAVSRGPVEDPSYFLELDVGSAFHDDAGDLYVRVSNLGGRCVCGHYWVDVDFGL